MSATAEILALLAEQDRTRPDLEALTGRPRGTLEVALCRLRQRQQITVTRLRRRRVAEIWDGLMGRPKGASVSYRLKAGG